MLKQKNCKIRRYLIAALVVMLCLFPLSSAYAADYLSFLNVNHTNSAIPGGSEQIKVGIEASADLISPDCDFAVESVGYEALGIGTDTDDYFECSIIDGDGNLITDFGEGKYVTLYVQVPTGMTAEEIQARIYIPAPCAQFDPEVVQIDGLDYLKLKAKNFQKYPVAKETDKAELKEYLASLKDPAEYREAQQEELKAILLAANSRIDAAITLEQFDGIKADTIAALDQVKTAAELPPEDQGNSGETDPEGGNPGEGVPGEVDPGEGTPGEVDPGEGAPGEVDPGEGTPGEVDPGEGAPGEVDPGEGTPGEVDPGEGAPGEADPGEGAPGEADPGEGAPGEVDPGQDEEPDPTIPQTGDDAQTGLWIMLTALSLAAFAVCVLLLKKSRTN